jgi:hypothetical protein
VRSVFKADFISSLLPNYGARGSVVIEALCYKSGGRRFDTR